MWRGPIIFLKKLQTSKLRSRGKLLSDSCRLQDTDPVVWNNRLLSAIDQTVRPSKPMKPTPPKSPATATEALRNFQNQLKYRGELYWHEWVKIAKTQCPARKAAI
jgi:hypothetical protein